MSEPQTASEMMAENQSLRLKVESLKSMVLEKHHASVSLQIQLAGAQEIRRGLEITVRTLATQLAAVVQPVLTASSPSAFPLDSAEEGSSSDNGGTSTDSLLKNWRRVTSSD